MPRSAAVLCRIAVSSAPAPTPDAQLLRAFLASGTDDAFTELVRRHGPMVLAACRRVLADAHDAEDAFQATFLVLARKAESIRGTNVAGWLHAVAIRTARGVRLTRDRQRKREQASGGRQPPVLSAPELDTAAIIDEELAKLPDYYRDAIVLCELRGLSRKEAATELGIREGTLSSRLAAAKRKLAARLSVRGLAGVTLATALAPAAVSAGLIEATSIAVRGAAGSGASAAASTVLKGMLFDQLRAMILTAAVLTAGVCGGLAMTGTPAADEPPGKAVAPVPDPTAKLVEQLGSADFDQREKAAKALRELGMKAEAALRAGLKSDDPEVRTRSAALLKQVREAELKAFLAGKVEPASPAWKRFKELLGDTEVSRKLFAEMMADDRRAQTVEKAETNPAKAAEVYASEVTRVAEAGLKSFEQFVGRPIQIPGPGQMDPKAVESRKAVPLGDVVAVLFLGTRPLPAGAKDPSASWALRASFSDGTSGPLKEPFRKLFVAWLDQRRDAETVGAALETALYTGTAEVLPVARRLAADAKLAAPAKGLVLLFVGNHGTLDDLPLLAAHRDDNRVYWDYTTVDKKRYEGQLRDAATAMSLLLRGQDYEKYGFTQIETHVWWLPANPAPYKAVHWFETDEDRTAAHKKAWAWLDKQKDVPKKDEPKPDPAAKLVERLGSADFAERERAEKALQELGAAAKAALLAGLKSEDPEVARRCGAILPVLRRADWQRARDAFAKNPAAFDHPVWTKLKAVVGDGADARAILADLLADERSFVALSEAIDDPQTAGRLHRQAHARLTRSLQDWYTADPKNKGALAMGKWVPERGMYPAMLLLGTFPGTGTEPAHNGDLNALSAHDQAGWSACWFGLCGAGERPQGHALARPSAGVQRLFVAWLGTRTSPKAAVAGLSMLRMLDCREGAALARTVAADRDRPVQDRTHALLHLAVVGNADDVVLATPLFNDATVLHQSADGSVQVRDRATVVALKLHKLEPVDFGFSGKRGDSQYLGFASNIVRDPILREAQAKVEELNRQRTADRLAPPPRPRP